MPSRSAKATVVVFLLALFATPLLADSTPHILANGNLFQDWSNTGLITANDNWSGILSFEGYLGQNITTATGANPQGLLGTSLLAGDLTVIADQTSTAISNGDVAEFHTTSQPVPTNANSTIALQGSGTADAPYLLMYLNTIGRSAVNVAYNLRDIDCTTDNAIQPVALQYRLGSSGNFTDLPGGYVADATAGPSLCSAVTAIGVTLPATADNQPLVQVRVMTTNAVGNDEWVGIDDIAVTSSPYTVASPNDPPSITAPSNPIATVGQDAAPFNVTLTGSDDHDVRLWTATPGTGISAVTVLSGQGTNSVTYKVTLQAGFSGTATFTASLSDTVNAAATQSVNIVVIPSGGGDLPPAITPPANPIRTVGKDASPFTVSLSGTDDYNIFNWGATAGTGISNVAVSGGQTTSTVTYTVTLQAGFTGTASFTATLSDSVNPTVNQTVNISVVPPASHITISQVYGGGGNTSAPYSSDYIELFNPTSSPVDVAGWSVQYASSTGNFTQVQPIGGIIGPGEYYLIGLASGAIGSAIPAPNISGTINMSGTTGKVALLSNGQPVNGTGCSQWLADPDVVDFVGYGSGANCYEGAAPAPAPSNITALFRLGAGALDTNENGSDFATGAPAPRITCPIQEIGPAVLDTDPRLNATTAPRDLSVIVTFTEDIDVLPGWFHINCASTGSHDSATDVVGAPRTRVITPNVTFDPGEQCTVTIYKNLVHDVDGDNSAPNTYNLASDYSWSFTVATGTAPPFPADVHLTMGNPSPTADPSNPDTYLMEKPEMAISYNSNLGRPNWVSWHLSSEWFGSLARVDTFRPDPEVLPSWYRVLASDFFASGFDRGHMTPNADRDKETSIPINQATYLMSNMVAQAPDNNQGPWAAMENDLRTLAGTTNELYIVSGPSGIGGTGSNGYATTITNGHVAVPERTWKVVLVLPKGSDDVNRVTAATRTIAVVMPNIQGIRDVPWTTYLTTVDAVEALTGYDFFSNVPDAIENAIEAGTNGTNPPGAADDSSSGNEDTAQPITLDAVSPSPSATLTYVIDSAPAHGSLSGTGPNFTYTPAPDYNGSDSFSYHVNDGTANSNAAVGTITVLEVNDAPTANADSFTTCANTVVVLTPLNLTSNDVPGPANELSQTLTLTAVTPIASTHGSLVLNAGTITYTPDYDYTGPASFNYTVCDNGVTAGLADGRCVSGIVNVTVGGLARAVLSGSLATCPNVPVTVHATISGTAPMTVTWSDGMVQPGVGPGDLTRTYAGTSSTSLTITDIDNGSCGHAGEGSVQITIPGPLSITQQPGSITVKSGSSATLAVVAPNASNYEWYEGAVGDTSHPVGANSSSFTTLPLGVGQSASYWVRVSNSCGSAIDSQPASITVVPVRYHGVRK